MNVDRNSNTELRRNEVPEGGNDLSVWLATEDAAVLDVLLAVPDDVHEALAARRRRIVLRRLREGNGRATVSELARAVADDDSRSSVESAAVSLRHIHVPKLADAELVEWHRDDEAVSLAVDPD